RTGPGELPPADAVFDALNREISGIPPAKGYPEKRPVIPSRGNPMIRGWWLGTMIFSSLLAGPARAVDQDRIDKAVAKGVAHLNRRQGHDGRWPRETCRGGDSGGETGATSLAALALLECGVAPDDPHMKQAASYIRSASPHITQTYSLSLAVMFLDRL